MNGRYSSASFTGKKRKKRKARFLYTWARQQWLLQHFALDHQLKRWWTKPEEKLRPYIGKNDQKKTKTPLPADRHTLVFSRVRRGGGRRGSQSAVVTWLRWWLTGELQIGRPLLTHSRRRLRVSKCRRQRQQVGMLVSLEPAPWHALWLRYYSQSNCVLLLYN